MSVNADQLWSNPLGEYSLGVLIHECAHERVSGHSGEFADEVERLGARLAIWVGKYPETWRQVVSFVK